MDTSLPPGDPRYASTSSETARPKHKRAIEPPDNIIPRFAGQKRIIIGTDDRYLITNSSIVPYRAICKLLVTDVYGRNFVGSGFFISSKCVITCGHCVYFNEEWADQIRVVPAINQTNAAGPVNAVSSRFRSVSGWTDLNMLNYDHGAVILPDDSLFNQVNAAIASSLNYAVQQEIEIAGYPDDKPEGQWGSKGLIKALTDFRIQYENDTVEGESGSPVLHTLNTQSYVIGVHGYGDNPNSSIRLKPDVLAAWEEWKAL